jgi:hypothetical protein
VNYIKTLAIIGAVYEIMFLDIIFRTEIEGLMKNVSMMFFLL